MRLPDQLWAGLRAPAGPVQRIALGAAAPRPVARLGPGERALLVLPGVPLRGVDLLQAEVAVALGPPDRLEAALWLLPEGAAPDSEAAIDPAAPGVRWSGWRSPAGDGRLALRLALLPAAPVAGVLALVLAHAGAAGEAAIAAEWSGLSGRRFGGLAAAST